MKDMKTKKLSKKLSLNRKTIANLNGDMMGNVYGGMYTIPAITCVTCDRSVCPTHCYTCVSRCQDQPYPGGEMMRMC